MDESINLFKNSYDSNKINNAFLELIPSRYSDISSFCEKGSISRLFIFFIHEICFGNLLSVKRLFKILKEKKLDQGIITDVLRDFRYMHVFPLSKVELDLLEKHKKNDAFLNTLFEMFSQEFLEGYLDNDGINENLSKLKDREFILLKALWDSFKNFSILRKKIPDFFSSISMSKEASLFKRPLWPLFFPKMLVYDEDNSADALWGIIFVEAQEIDWKSILKDFEDKSCLFVFYDTNSFYRNLRNTSFVEFLRVKRDAILILNTSIDRQIQAQAHFKATGNPFLLNMTTVFERSTVKKVSSMIVDLLNGDQQSSQNLKHYMRNLRYRKMKASFGDSCLLAIQDIFFWENRESENQEFNHYSKELEEIKIQDYGSYFHSIRRLKKRSLGEPPFKVAHVMPLFIKSCCHAPSTRVSELLDYYNREYFEPIVFSTDQNFSKKEEFLGNYSNDYSIDFLEKGFDVFEKIKTPIFSNTQASRYIENALYFAYLLKEKEIDIAIFHEPFATNQLLIQMSDTPIKLFMEHGFYSVQDELDAVIVSHENQRKRAERLFAKTNTKVITNPKVLDTKRYWTNHILTPEELGLPKNARVLMTISNLLDSRLSDKMCFAIRKILQETSNSYFIGIGHLDGIKRKKNLINMGDRVRFLGPRMDAKHLLRSADVYLNEFPIGGGCVIYEAMLAGCPVVTMKGEGIDDASFEGADYLGDDLAISSNKIEDYIDLAICLLNDSKKHLFWRKEVQKRAELRGDIKDYALRHQKILFQCIEECASKLSKSLELESSLKG